MSATPTPVPQSSALHAETRYHNLQWLHQTLKANGMSLPDFMIASADLVRQTPLFFWHQQEDEVKEKSEVRMERAKRDAIKVSEAQHLSYQEHLIVICHMMERAGFYILNQNGGETITGNVSEPK